MRYWAKLTTKLFLFSLLTSNILIKKNGRATLGDMGHSRVISQQSSEFNLFSNNALSNRVFGTDGYLAPEAIDGSFNSLSCFSLDIW